MRHFLPNLILHPIAEAVRLFFAPVRWSYFKVWGKQSSPSLIEFIELAHRTGGPHSWSCNWYLHKREDDVDLQRRADAFKMLWEATKARERKAK